LQVHIVLEDNSGNQLRSPDVHKATTSPDTRAPIAKLRPPCSVPDDADCPDGPGLKYCGNIGSSYVDMHVTVGEAGATYFALMKLSNDSSTAAWSECEALQVSAGMMYEVPEGEQWQGCASSDRRRSLLAQRPLLGGASPAAANGALRGTGRAPELQSSAEDIWMQLMHPKRRLLDLSVSPQPGCMAEQPCDCCHQNVNCRLTHNQVWGSRALLEDAGTQLVSACSYMYASPCAQLPVMEAFAAALGPPASPFPAAPLLAATPLISTASPISRSLLASASELASGGLQPQDAQRTHASRTLQQLEQLSPAAMALETGNSSAGNYRQPLYVDASQDLRNGLEADTYYAFFAVTEDQIRPMPNVLPTAHQWIFRTQRTDPPSCRISCPPEGSTLDSIQLDVELNTTGTVFYVVQGSGAIDAPTASQVRMI
jgi:hypothetical protein